jgi:two-component system NarL family sensor kinase
MEATSPVRRKLDSRTRRIRRGAVAATVPGTGPGLSGCGGGNDKNCHLRILLAVPILVLDGEFLTTQGTSGHRWARAVRIGPRSAAWLALSLPLLSSSFVVLALVLAGLQGELPPLAPIPLSAAVVFPAVGAFVAARRPDNPLGWIFCGIGLSVGVTAFAGAYGDYSLSEPGSFLAAPMMEWLASWAWFPGLALTLTFLLLLYPDGRLPSRHWRPIGVIASISIASAPLAASSLALEPRVAAAFAAVGLLALAVSAPASVASLVLRFRRAEGPERQQLKWFCYGGALTMMLLLPSLFIDFPGRVVLGLIAVSLLPVAACVAILKYRLYDIDLVINRSLVYGSLTASVVGAYVTIVSLLGQLFQRTGFGVSLVATAVVAVLFQPLRERLQRGVNHLMYGQRDDPYEVISRLGQKLESSLPSEEVLPSVTQMVARALRLPYVAIELRQDEGFAIAARYGEPVGELVRLPLAYQGATIGQLVASERAVGEAFSAADRRLLEDLARQAGAAAHAVGLTADLRRSRGRLVTAREEERRRLRRDLHDGLGPALAGVAMEIQAARNLIKRDSSAADILLGKLQAETQAAIGEIRRLVYGLRPPALDELGLVHALEEQATSFVSEGLADGKSSLQVSIDTSGDLHTLPAAVEVAAYRIALEAITNASLHSGATTCTVRLRRNQALELEVSDDGSGLPIDHHAGVGLTSMRERTAELGGDFTIESALNGGTRVFARLPLDRNQ